MNPSDTNLLLQLLNGELTPTEEASLRERLTASPELRTELDHLRSTRMLLQRTIRESTEAAVRPFFADRLKVHLREQGIRHDLINAVFALGGEDDLVRLLARVDALKGFLGTDDGASLLTAHKRASNIVAIEEKKDSASYDGEADAALLSEDEEKALHSRLGELKTRIAPVLAGENFDDAMAVLAELRQPVDDFFDRVTVNCEDGKQRVNRLKLLSQIRATMGEIADFGQIEG